MNDLYGTTTKEERTVKPKTPAAGVTVANGEPDQPLMVHTRLWDANGIRENDHWKDSGLRGLRAFGFDYSGKSGAPLLMVIIDKIEGGKKRDWTWQHPGDALPRGAGLAKPKITGDDKSFTFDYGDANLKATFVSPGDVKVQPNKHERIDYNRWQGKFVEFDRVSAVSDGGNYFVVVTLQQKDAPPVKVEGAGLDARVTVGNQTVRFDGTKVIFGQ